MPPLVTILSPCYNVSDYINEFLASVASQTHRPLQLILIDDGSTDQTWDRIDSARPDLESAGIQVQTVRQSNQGLAAAINSGLKHVQGEFLIWPDPDDWLTPDSITKRLQVLRKFPHAALVRTNVVIFNQDSGEFEGPYLKGDSPDAIKTNLHLEILLRQSFTAPVMHMVRTEALFSVYPEKSIFQSRRASQNFQILIPLAIKFEVCESRTVTGFYRKRSDSRSHAAAQNCRLRIAREETIRKVLWNLISLKLGPETRSVNLAGFYDAWFCVKFLVPFYFVNEKTKKIHLIMRQISRSGALDFVSRSLLLFSKYLPNIPGRHGSKIRNRLRHLAVRSVERRTRTRLIARISRVSSDLRQK